MSNEASVIELLGHNSSGDVMSFTCAAGTAITQGCLMILSDPRTIAKHATTIGGLFAGVASADKDASDTSTSLGVYTNGVFKMAASGTINAGDQVIVSSVANYVESSNTCIQNSKIVGTALDNASGSLVSVRVLN